MRIHKLGAGVSFAALVLAASQMHTGDAAAAPYVVHPGVLRAQIARNNINAMGVPGGVSVEAQRSVAAFRAQVARHVVVRTHPFVVNKVVLAKLRQRPKRSCGPHEVSPGHFVTIDCNHYAKARRATPRNDRLIQLRHRMLLSKTLRTSSIHKTDGSVGYPTGDDGALPDGVDHRSDGTEGMVYDQGQVGSCTANSLAGAMNNAIIRQQSTAMMSPMHLWSHYGTPDMDLASGNNLNKPTALVTDWPMDFPMACRMYHGGAGDQNGCGASYNVSQGSADLDPTVEAMVRINDAHGAWQLSGLSTLFERDYVNQPDGVMLSTDDMDMMASALAQGNDIWMAMQINADAFCAPMANNNFLIGDYGSQDTGGHAIVFAGYRTTSTGREWLIHNSWGDGSNDGVGTPGDSPSNWGDNGYAWIKEVTVQKHLEMAYTVTVAPVKASGGCQAGTKLNPTNATDSSCYPTCTGAEQVSPCPNATQCDPQNGICIQTAQSCTLTDDSCNWDQLVDSATCQCAAICPDDTREANGVCGGGGTPTTPTTPTTTTTGGNHGVQPPHVVRPPAPPH